MDSDKNQIISTLPSKGFMIYALVFIAVGVGLGAIGAHSLENIPALTSKNIESWKTGVLYQLLMSLGLLLMIIFEKTFQLKSVNAAKWTLAIGTALFSISIYLLVLNHIWHVEALKWTMIPLTPIGGVLMIVAWLLFAWSVAKNRSFHV